MITKRLILILCIFILLNASLSVDPETYLRASYGDFEIEGYSHKTFNFTEYDWFSAHNDTNITHSKCRYIHNSLNASSEIDWNPYLSIPIIFRDIYSCIVNVTDQDYNTVYMMNYATNKYERAYNSEFYYDMRRLRYLDIDIHSNDEQTNRVNGSWYDSMIFDRYLFIAFKGKLPSVGSISYPVTALRYGYDTMLNMNSDLHKYENIFIPVAINNSIGADNTYRYLDMSSISYIEPYVLNTTIDFYYTLIETVSEELYGTLTELISVMNCETEKCYITKDNYESLSYSVKTHLYYNEQSYACFAFNKDGADDIKIICTEFLKDSQLFSNSLSFEYNFERNRTNLKYLKIYGNSFIFEHSDHYFYVDLKYNDNTTESLRCNIETNYCDTINQHNNYNLHIKSFMDNPSYSIAIATSTDETIKLSENKLHTKEIVNGNTLYTTDQYFNCFRYEYHSLTTLNWVEQDLISYCNGVSYSITLDKTQLINITNAVENTNILDKLDNWLQIGVINTGLRHIAKIEVNLSYYDGSTQTFYYNLKEFSTTAHTTHFLSTLNLFVNINKTMTHVPVLIALYDQYDDLIYYDIKRLDFMYGDTFITLTSNGEKISEFMINGDVHYNVYAVPDNITEIIISVANRIKPTIYKLNPYQTGYLNIDMESYHWISRSWYPYFWENTAILSIYENDSIDYFKIIYADPSKTPVVLVPSLAKLDLLIDFLSGDDTDMLGFERTKTDPLFQFVFDYSKYITVSDKYIKICIKFTNNTNLYCSNKYKNNTYYVLGKGFIITFLIILIILALTAIYITKIK